ncbi:sirohydrochlorin cobaltochelatase [Sulfolobales archaeon SCGC AB-777_J03]|nr:sirohydrochlorin cobaltochelatase [Sulfolobales archaeon SCGC AB-777_J03]
MIGILLALHGSKDPAWSEVAKGYKELLSRWFGLVEVGYLEYNSPTLREALEALAAKGADSVVVVPLFISLGTHLKKDIPKALGLEGEFAMVNGKKVRVRVAEPIGVDERVAEVLAERARKAMNGL